jgi:hypothetical protein
MESHMISARGFARIGMLLAAGLVGPAYPADSPPEAKDLTGLHAFDTQVGCWSGQNRLMLKRLAGSHDWIEFKSTRHLWQLKDGYLNVDDETTFMQSGTYHGADLRAYDPKTGEWTTWVVTGGNDLDPPLRGRFADGTGTFYGKDSLDGRPILVRFTWSQMTSRSAHWEQAYSGDDGKTWETNWQVDFQRIPCKDGP